MFGSEILEVAIGLVFIYLLLCLLCSGINEAVARVFAWRSKTLEDALKKLIDDPGLIEKLYKNPLISELNLDRRYRKILKIFPVFKHSGKPTFISSQSFVMILFDHLQKESNGMSKEDLKKKIEGLPEGDLKHALQTLLKDIDIKATKLEETVTNLREETAKWFDHKMEQLSAWYKRKAKVFIFIIALIVTSFFNIDTFMIASNLYHNRTLRQSVVNAAVKLSEQDQSSSPEKLSANVKKMVDEFHGKFQLLGLPIGWSDQSKDEKKNEENKPARKDPRRVPNNTQGWIYKVLGLLITSIAVTLGAPFWFQKLKALIQIRGEKKSPVPKE